MDAESGELFVDSWTLDTLSSSELVFSQSEKPLQDWTVDPNCTLADSESEDVLAAVDPNEVFPSGTPSDDGSVPESPVTMATAQPVTIYQVVYDISGVGGAKTSPGQENVISIELDQWKSQLLLSDSCVVSELPASVVAPPAGLDPDLLELTEEEQKLLVQEGVTLPGILPLTKAEERILKRVRRKIRNKQSAQDSRRRRKEYIDGLETRAAACSAQNKELQRTVEQLEKHNTSLLAQLQQLQSLIKQTVSKGAQTSTCLLIILVSLGLIILPSFSPFRRDLSSDDDSRPMGVLSRNILTEPSSSQSPPPGEAESDSSPSPPDDVQDLTETRENPGGGLQEGDQSGNSSVLVLSRGNQDPTKPGHADEM
ncbi:cyclic AMP-responsive element-binding protein 3-like protein 4 [Mugil cephalus]|uniref:cyclic AMP-responsive element-binding protein 3-like protein 4 n=1 Tax=Mugil cephalus TaxID=48193 RepID=UPI001FB5D1FD|nr:cyclic AMP-responsive element-binding protein 3-like protein 4 [Mugil cephalus]XP_047455625.1 cyclic AMP-responsive element-binding protein 3-like protein 4 [Mugil cephalus]XP_047455626.1 cyclic AMP-responsive element-binding protein 3-like protein 4 [Mugil cephalus]XP_047455627.1 cyclic AMP-responsive element-binding protein 3-like protein 4 [Mugil cephalus]XP_047455628.1 cyclic AMP-responsive element-binding protein 3-like protein 4 [Mugil cephalus]XP_047455629.1 cyclic AMP-responsive ele